MEKLVSTESTQCKSKSRTSSKLSQLFKPSIDQKEKRKIEDFLPKQNSRKLQKLSSIVDISSQF